jgi:hypothetical protein
MRRKSGIRALWMVYSRSLSRYLTLVGSVNRRLMSCAIGMLNTCLYRRTS